jgi:hypothetical protein
MRLSQALIGLPLLVGVAIALVSCSCETDSISFDDDHHNDAPEDWGVIRGTVRVQGTAIPVEDVQVVISGEDTEPDTCRSDADGKYEVRATACARPVDLTAMREGYLDYEAEVMPWLLGPVTHDIYMAVVPDPRGTVPEVPN